MATEILPIDSYALRVRDKSMHPALRNDWVVVVEPNARCVINEFVVIAMNDGRRMVRRLLVDGTEEVTVQSVNDGTRMTLQRADMLHMHSVAGVIAPSKWEPSISTGASA